jgi:hypothetical protein
MLLEPAAGDYLSNCVVLAVIQSTASFFVAKPSIRRSWPSWYLMTTCHPVPTLSGKGSITGFSSESGMQAICTWAVSASSPAFGLRGSRPQHRRPSHGEHRLLELAPAMKEERGFGRLFLARVVPIGHRRRWPTASPPAGLSCGNWAPSGALFLFGRAMIVARRKVAWSR